VYEVVLDGSRIINDFRNRDLKNSFYGHVKTEAKAKKLISKKPE